MFYSLFFVLLCLSGLSFVFSGITPVSNAGLEIKVGLLIALIPFSHFTAQYFATMLGGATAKAADKDNQAQADEAVRFLFVKTLFIALGRVANADNRVCDNELAFAEQVVVRLKLCADYADMAVESFQTGIYNHSDFDKDLLAFAKASERKRGLQQIFFEILLDMASKSGEFTRAEFLLLEKIRNMLQPNRYLDELLATSRPEVEFEAEEAESEQTSQQSSNQSFERNNTSGGHFDKKTRNAFKLLGLRVDAQVADIKRRYRQLMKMHHPDRLIAEGMPTDLIEQATQRAAKINKAYKHLRSVLNFR